MVLLGLLVPRVVLAEVIIEGIGNATGRAVRASLGLAGEPCELSDARLRRQFRQADGEIRRALEVYGYYEPLIDKHLERGADCWTARFTITPGRRVTLREVQVVARGEGAEDRPFRRLLRNPPFRTGDGLDQRAYDQYKAEIANLARRRGYFDGRWVTSRIDVWPDEFAAAISLEYDTGPRYRFGPVAFEQDVLDPDVVQGFVEFEPGEPFHADVLNRLYTALLVSGFFQGVDVQTVPRPESTDVLVSIALTPALRRDVTTGVGYGTDTGVKLRFGYLDSRRNQRGHQLELNSTLSEILGEVTASYRTPLDSPRDEWRSFDAGYRYDNPEDSRSEQYRFGVKEIHRRGQLWRETRFLDLSFEDYRVGEVRDTSRLLIPGISLSRQTEFLPARPRSAGRLGVQLSGTGTFLGSDTDFLQFEATGKLIRSFWPGGRVLVRGEVGTTLKDELEDLPFSVRFFAGGDYSVRGYDYKALGPTDDEGNVIGGSHRLVGSLEVDQRVRDNWAAAAFVDIGNAFDSFKDMGLKTSVGAGVRWYSPLGPIRLDVAFPLDDAAPDSFRIHITLGPDL